MVGPEIIFEYFPNLTEVQKSNSNNWARYMPTTMHV